MRKFFSLEKLLKIAISGNNFLDFCLIEFFPEIVNDRHGPLEFIFRYALIVKGVIFSNLQNVLPSTVNFVEVCNRLNICPYLQLAGSIKSSDARIYVEKAWCASSGIESEEKEAAQKFRGLVILLFCF